MSYMVSHLVPYPKPKAPQSQITFLLTYSPTNTEDLDKVKSRVIGTTMLKHNVTILLTYSLRLYVDCNVGAPRADGRHTS